MRNYKIYPQVVVALAGKKLKVFNWNINEKSRSTAYGGAFIFGISLGWSSPAAPRLFSDSNNFSVSKNQFSWIVSIMALGATFATASAGILRNKVGTKLTVVLFAIPTTIGWILIIFARNAEMVSLKFFSAYYELTTFSAHDWKILQRIRYRLLRNPLASLYRWNLIKGNPWQPFESLSNNLELWRNFRFCARTFLWLYDTEHRLRNYSRHLLRHFYEAAGVACFSCEFNFKFICWNVFKKCF